MHKQREEKSRKAPALFTRMLMRLCSLFNRDFVSAAKDLTLAKSAKSSLAHSQVPGRPLCPSSDLASSHLHCIQAATLRIDSSFLPGLWLAGVNSMSVVCEAVSRAIIVNLDCWPMEL